MNDKAETSKGLSVVAVVGSVEEGDIIRAALDGGGIESFASGMSTSQWLPHFGLSVNKEILVRSEDLEKARELLASIRAEEKPETDIVLTSNTPDDYAERCARSALWMLIFLPVIVLVPYYFCKAIFAACDQTVENPQRYRRNLVLGFLLGILVPISIVLAIILIKHASFDPEWVTGRHPYKH